MAGLLIGFISTFIFFVIAATLIIKDEIQRHNTYEQLLVRDQRKLTTDCGLTQQQFDAVEAEFLEAEKKRG